MTGRSLEAHGSGESVESARAAALASLRALAGSFDEAAAEVVVVNEGDPGLMGVGIRPAEVLARILVDDGLGPVGEHVHDVLERIVGAIDPELRVAVSESGLRVNAVVSGAGTALVIGRHGQTIDAISHLVSAICLPSGEERWEITIDAAGYRERREQRLRGIALRAAERATREGAEQHLEPMSAAERRIVHLVLADDGAVVTESAGREPARYVVVSPAGDPAP